MSYDNIENRFLLLHTYDVSVKPCKRSYSCSYEIFIGTVALMSIGNGLYVHMYLTRNARLSVLLY